jgi:tetratricopeptide (TPR) repeat protein
VQLIDAVSGYHMWSQTYDRNFTDILKIQSELAAPVSEELKVKLLADEADKMEIGGTKNADAYDAYLRGSQLTLTGVNDQDSRARLAAFERAIAADPNYAAALASTAFALTDRSYRAADVATRDRLRDQALLAAKRAIAVAPEYDQAHLALAIVLEASFDFAGATTEFERALALGPGDARVLRDFAFFAGATGRTGPALKTAQRAVSLDPQNFLTHQTLASVYFFARHYDEAKAALLHALALAPREPDNAQLMALVLIASGQIHEAQERCESSTTAANDDARHSCLAIVYHAQGRRQDAEREFKQYQADRGDADAYGYADIYAEWGDSASALQWLIKAERLHDPDLVGINTNASFDPLRDDPQFKALVARLNFRR